MTLPSSTGRGGGFILAVAIVAGAVGGTMVGQASAGFIIGAAVGILLALLVWMNDHRK